FFNNKMVVPREDISSIVYVIDFAAKPITLDIVFMSKISQSIVYKMIIEFLSPDIIRVNTYFNHKRPTDFDNSTSFIMKKRNR
ncbi:MAG TPA: hypothetical protein PK771_15890, partial [Spirochaetota bacterium]|nr:hypothetical protein [Spirochaetota bacterium]